MICLKPLSVFSHCKKRINTNRGKEKLLPLVRLCNTFNLAEHPVHQADRLNLLFKIHFRVDFGGNHAAMPQHLFYR